MLCDGFLVCGQHCNPKSDGSTIDFEKMMYACYSDIPIEQLNIMKDNGPYFCNILRQTGRITYDQLVEAGINPGITTIARDKLCYVRHWSEIVNHGQTVERFKLEAAARDPINIARKQQEEADRKLIKKTADACEKALAKETKKMHTLELKAAERLRFQALDPDMQRAEIASKKLAALEKKKKRIEEEKESHDAAVFRMGMSDSIIC